MRIVIANLPGDATAEGLRHVLAVLGPVGRVEIRDEGDPRGLLAFAEFDINRNGAELLAQKIGTLRYGERELRAFVPLHQR